MRLSKQYLNSTQTDHELRCGLRPVAGGQAGGNQKDSKIQALLVWRVEFQTVGERQEAAVLGSEGRYARRSEAVCRCWLRRCRGTRSKAAHVGATEAAG